jgi:hypothetical protein
LRETKGVGYTLGFVAHPRKPPERVETGSSQAELALVDPGFAGTTTIRRKK